MISTDGRYVAFTSDAPNLVDGDDNETDDVFVRDLRTQRNVLVSRADGRRGELGDGSSSEIAISGDGRSVAFTTQANNLSDEAPVSYFPVLVRDLRRNRTIYVSRASGARGRGPTTARTRRRCPATAAWSPSTPTPPTSIPPTAATVPTSTCATCGRTARCWSAAPPAHVARNGNGASEGASISADGRYVAFVSRARNLHPDDTDGRRDVYVRDLRRNVTGWSARARARRSSPRSRPTGATSRSSTAATACCPRTATRTATST